MGDGIVWPGKGERSVGCSFSQGGGQDGGHMGVLVGACGCPWGAHSAKVGDTMEMYGVLLGSFSTRWCIIQPGGGCNGDVWGACGCLWGAHSAFSMRWWIVQPRWGTQWGQCLWGAHSVQDGTSFGQGGDAMGVLGVLVGAYGVLVWHTMVHHLAKVKVGDVRWCIIQPR